MVPWLSALIGLQIVGDTPASLLTVVAVGFLIGGVATGIGIWYRGALDTIPAASYVGPRTVFEELKDIVIVTDLDGRVVKINGAVEYYFGTTRATAVGADIAELCGMTIDDLTETDTI